MFTFDVAEWNPTQLILGDRSIKHVLLVQMTEMIGSKISDAWKDKTAN